MDQKSKGIAWSADWFGADPSFAKGDAASLATLIHAQRQPVERVCRRYLQNPADIDDAVQETFIRLMHARDREQIHTNLSAWLRATARSVAIDLLRKRGRDRNHLETLQHEPRDHGRGILRERARRPLRKAIASLDDETRRILIARFLRQKTVGRIAEEMGLSQATASRRCAAGLRALRRALNDLGIATPDDLLLKELFGAGATGPRCEGDGSAAYDPLHLALAWNRTTGHTPLMPDGAPGQVVSSGRSRSIRIGMLLSHQSTLVPSPGNWYPPLENQMIWCPWLGWREYQKIGIVEPGTHHLGHIERGLRTYELTSGLIEASDRAAMRRLDVIVLGHTYAISDAVIDAVLDAVETGGVGLYHHGHAGMHRPGLADPRLQKLLLAAGPIGIHHVPGHRMPLSASVIRSHAVIAGLSRGTQLLLHGCGPTFPLRSDATLLIQKDDVVTPSDGQSDPAAGPGRMPVLALGTIGRGRVAVIAQADVRLLLEHPSLQGNLVANLIEHLAQPHLDGEVEGLAEQAIAG